MEFVLESITWMISAYLFVVGSVFASFASLIGDRVPRGISIVQPPSYCPKCGHRLSPFELVPILSWLLLRGKCRKCRANIPLQYPVFELLLGLVLAVSYLKSTYTPIYVLENGVLWFVILIAMTTDIQSLVVPNWLTLPAGALCFVLSIWTGHSISQTIVGMVVGFGTIFLIHVLSKGSMGIGDAKLYISIGAIIGPGPSIESFILASAYGAIIGSLMRWSGRLKPKQPVPFVPFIGLGVATTQFLLPNLWSLYMHTVFGIQA